MKTKNQLSMPRLLCGLMACAAMLYAAPVTITENQPEPSDGQIELLRKVAHSLAEARTYTYTAGTGGVTIAAGKQKWSVTAIGGTATINVGGAGVITVPEGMTRNSEVVPGFVTSQSVVVANGTGTANYSYQTPVAY